MSRDQENKLGIFKELMSNDQIRGLVKSIRENESRYDKYGRDNELVIKYLEELLDDEFKIV